MEHLITTAKYTLTALYVAGFVLLCAFGFHRHYLSSVFNKNKSGVPRPVRRFKKLPRVTVQLPVYNEMYVASRLIKAVCAIDYPVELLHIQVLDDSTDSTTEIAEASVREFRSHGLNIELIHRNNREGFKAGALAEGLRHTDSELIAIFDADFIPPSDFLRQTVDFFTDPNVGGVQVRWGHLNRDYSTLTKAQSVLLDGQFIIEQSSRYYGGMFFNFNGTAGVLRRRCIESAGGWQHDTLTEDLDLSYRAQLKGWRFIYLKDVVADAELPVDMNAFKAQQHRWTKGAIQTAKKILPHILKNPLLSYKVKIEAAFHLLGGLSYPLLLMVLLLMTPVAYFWRSLGWEKVILLNLIAISAGTLSLLRFYSIALKEVYGQGWKRRAHHIPVAIALGTGIAVNNTKAVLEALLGKSSEFTRTPKFAVTNKGEGWAHKNYTSPKGFTAVIELALGLFFTALTLYALSAGHIIWVPLAFYIQLGFLYTSISSLLPRHKKTGRVG